MTTLQHAIDQFASRARITGYKLSTESNEGQPFTILVGDDRTGLRLTWNAETSRLVIAITQGDELGGSDWLDLYDRVVDDTNELPIDNDVSITDAIDYGVELMTPSRNPVTLNPDGG